VKPHRIHFNGAETRRAVIERILRTRLSEALDLAPALTGRERQALHNFRIACKRLRYALERYTNGEPHFERAAERLASVQDALGEAHDRDVLLTILPPNMPETERRLMHEREVFVDRAASEWSAIVPQVVR
jgi:CHAD domain-containing protein